MTCGYRWDGDKFASDRIAISHHCALDADHIGEAHACRCGAEAPFAHDDLETQAVEETP